MEFVKGSAIKKHDWQQLKTHPAELSKFKQR
jgi:hypothetical protein